MKLALQHEMSQSARVVSAPSPVRGYEQQQQQQLASTQQFDEPTKYQINVAEKKGWRKVLAFLGPGFLVCIAYIDPGNFESDLQSGAQYKYELLWIILVASISALIIQSLAANLGVVTGMRCTRPCTRVMSNWMSPGKHLAEHCRTEYPQVMRYVLWLFAEVAIIAADIPEVIGTAFALNILVRLPTWAGVLMTGLSTLFLLALQRYGVRKLEFVVAMLVMTMTVCFFAELGYAKPSSKEVLKGLFVPQLRGNGATRLAVSLLGALVMPHNLYLHSAIVLTRKVERTNRGIKDGCRFYVFESAFALFFAFLINICVISVSGAVCSSPNLSSADKSKCEELDLNQASFLLRNVLGGFSKVLFGIALLASGQSSTITGTYAGQYVMQGFLNIRLEPWLRNLMTRSFAIVPSLTVALIGGNRAAGDLIITCSMILSFVLPYVLIPMLKFTGSKVKMGPFANSWPITIVSWIIGGLVMVINMYFLASSFIKWLVDSHLHLGIKVFVGTIVFSLIAAYLVGILYLTLRLDRQGTYSIDGNEKPPAVEEPAPAADISMAELGYNKANVPPEFRLEQQLERRVSLPRVDIIQMQLPRMSSSPI